VHIFFASLPLVFFYLTSFCPFPPFQFQYPRNSSKLQNICKKALFPTYSQKKYITARQATWQSFLRRSFLSVLQLGGQIRSQTSQIESGNEIFQMIRTQTTIC